MPMAEMPAARRLTDPRTRTTAMIENARVALARNTSNVTIIGVFVAEQGEHRIHGQILKFTRRYMMKLPTPIQHAATPSAILVMLSCQTLE